MNNSDTPQTDDMKFNMYTEEGEILCEVVRASFCADIEVHRDQLIRELAELNSSLESERITRNHVIQKGADHERENARLREALRECLDGAAYTVSVDAILDPNTRHIGLEN